MSIRSMAKSIGLAAAIVVGSALPAFAVTAYATTNVNVRSCDSTSCRVVDVLRRGERVEIDYCRGAWCAVEKPGRDGWVNANYLSRGGDYYDDDDYYYDDDFYIAPRRRVYRSYPRFRGPDFSACVGGPNARFCVYD
jgi:uncharacterized protein YraI